MAVFEGCDGSLTFPPPEIDNDIWGFEFGEFDPVVDEIELSGKSDDDFCGEDPVKDRFL